jgi:hypothetical protein
MLKMLLVSDDEITASLRSVGYEEHTANNGDSVSRRREVAFIEDISNKE